MTCSSTSHRVDVAASCEKAGVPEAQVREAARAIGGADGGVSIFEDLGIQQAPHSTLNSYLEKLIVLLTGNFGVPGGMNLHTHFAALVGGKSTRAVGGIEPSTPVTGHRLVTGLVPCNVIPDEILTDHPDRFRALLVESGNPVHSIADSQRMREALDALDLVVVIDVALTETARCADYVLPGGVAVREVGVHVLQPRVPAQLLPPSPAGVRADGRHAAGAGDPRPPVPGARRVQRRRPRPAPRGRRRRPGRVHRGALRSRRRAAGAGQAAPGDPLRDARPDAAHAGWCRRRRCRRRVGAGADGRRLLGCIRASGRLRGAGERRLAGRCVCSMRSSPARPV